MMRLLIIGGSDAGISAALRAREIDGDADVTVVVADSFPNYSICGLPFYVSGEVPDWRRLAHRTVEEIEREGIRLLLNHTATAIEPAKKIVEVVNARGQRQTLSYDRLVIATGAVPAHIEVPGADLPGVYPLHTMEDSFRVQRHVAEKNPQTAIIVGAGYIALEMADAFRHRDLRVSLIVRSQVLRATIDAGLARVVEDELRRQGVEIVKQVDVESIQRDGSRLLVAGSNGFRANADLVLIAAGVRPSSELAAGAGIQTGVRGAIRVDREMATNVPGIYAAGDCVETWHRMTGQNTYLPLGTTAHKQGRVAGENAAGGHRRFAGSLGTQVVKVFDLAVARTGLRDGEARNAGFDPFTTESKTWDHKAYYPGAHELVVRVTGDRRSGRLLGAQIVGHWQAEVAKRIDIFAAALYHEMKVEDLNDLDLSYTPPVGSPWDAVQMAAQDWVRQKGAGA
jgi:NADPH-dependent 2,4-dienoyl-CoA reductase/sulfur reductase-like enzyme